VPWSTTATIQPSLSNNIKENVGNNRSQYPHPSTYHELIAYHYADSNNTVVNKVEVTIPFQFGCDLSSTTFALSENGNFINVKFFIDKRFHDINMRSMSSPDAAKTAYIHFLKNVENVVEYSIPIYPHCVLIESVVPYSFKALDINGDNVTGHLAWAKVTLRESFPEMEQFKKVKFTDPFERNLKSS